MFGESHSWQIPIVEYVVPLQTSQPVKFVFGPKPAAHAEHDVWAGLTTFGGWHSVHCPAKAENLPLRWTGYRRTPSSKGIVHPIQIRPLTYGSSVSGGDLYQSQKHIPSKSPFASGDGSTPQAKTSHKVSAIRWLLAHRKNWLNIPIKVNRQLKINVVIDVGRRR